MPPTREQYLAQAVKRGLLSSQQAQEKQYGTISERPGLFEKSLPMAGQILGGLAGSRGGALGVGAGATAGAVAGRAGQLFMRKSRGEQISPSQAAGELGTEGAITGAVETAFPVAGRLARPIVKPLADRFVKNVVRPRVAGTLRFFTGITPENTKRVLERSPKNVVTNPLQARDKGIRIAEEFLGNAQDALGKVNKQWVSVTDPLRKNPASVVSSQPIRKAAQTVATEFLGTPGPVLPGTKDVFRETRRALQGVMQLASGDSIPLDTALRARQQLDEVVFQGKARGLMSTSQVVALTKLRTSFKDSIHSSFPQIAQVDTQRHVIGEALQVIERFSPESVTSVAKLGKMIDAFEETSVGPAAREALQQADAEIAKTTGKSLLDAIRDRAAAQAFEPTEIRAVRSYLIQAVLVGMGLGGFVAAGPGGAAMMTGLGVGLSSPWLAGRGLKVIAAAGRGVKLFARKTAPVVRAATAEAGRSTFLRPKQESP